MSEGVSANGGGSSLTASFTLSDGVVTYKRRKRCLAEILRDRDLSGSTGDQKEVERGSTSCNGICATEGQSRIQHHWKTILHQLLLSQDVCDDVVSSCIQKALLAGDSNWSFMTKRAHSSPFHRKLQNVETHSGMVHMVNGTICDESKRAVSMQISSLKNKEVTPSVLNSHLNGRMDDHDISKTLENALVEILSSEKFALLCDLLVGKLPGIKPNSVLDFSVISSKMKNRESGLSIGLLHQDLQLIWDKIRRIGQELDLLATSLSNISRTSLQRQMGNHFEVAIGEHEIKKLHEIGTEEKNSMDSHTTSLFPCESDPSAKREQTEASCPHKLYISREDGIKLHQGCVVCHKLKSSGMLLEPTEYKEEEEGQKGQKEEGSQESSISNLDSDGQLDPKRTVRDRLCKLCGTREDEDKRFITCDHSLCIYKYYHIRCLKSHQVVRQHHKHGGWYCPSCLCRECLVDKDDELIVMCDGCDEGFHIYCMKPPLSSVPKGKWFCVSCNIQRAKLGMRRYEQWVLQQHAQSEEKLTDGSNRPMDLLLSAAEKVEKLSAGKELAVELPPQVYL